MKKIISTSSVILIAGSIALSSVYAETEENETSTKNEETTSQAPVPTLYSTDTNTMTPTATTTSAQDTTSADRNNDGAIDPFEQCAFVQKKSESDCTYMKETMKKKMWEQYGSGTYNPNAFERNQNGGIMMKEMNKKMNSERKDMKQEIKNDRTQMNQQMKDERNKMMRENEQNRQMMGSGARQENKNNRQEFKEGAKEQKQEMKNETKAKKRALSDKLHTQLSAAVEKLPVEKLNKVLANIDKAKAKIESSALDQTKKDNFLAQLEEIRGVIQAKIDALSGATSEINLNDILGGTTTDTPTTDTTSTSGTVTQ